MSTSPVVPLRFTALPDRPAIQVAFSRVPLKPPPPMSRAAVPVPSSSGHQATVPKASATRTERVVGLGDITFGV